MNNEDFELLDLNEEEAEENCLSPEEEKRTQKPDMETAAADWKKELKSILYTVLITVVVVTILKSYVIINARVPTGSMENTILPGDNILGYRMAYLLEEPQRGDVIFFYFPDDETQKYVKRVIGLPGEKVYINEGKIYINDAELPLEETYLKEEWVAGIGPYEFQIPEDSYLVLGDNRNYSADARYWKNPYVAKDKIIGKAIFTYYPFNRLGFVE